MTTFEKKPLSLPLTALTALLALGGANANAANLFEVLFGGGAPRASDFPPPPPEPAPAKKKPSVAAVRVTGPIYYTYKTDSLVKVDFSALMSAPQPIAYDPSAQSDAFRQGLQGLDGFDLLAERDIAKALTDYYAANPAFIWVTGDNANARAEETVRVLSDAASYGLVPSEYYVQIPTATSSNGSAARQTELMRFEMSLSARVLRYVRDAQQGRIDPNRISGYYDFPAKPLDLAGALRTLAHTAEVRAFLESRHPQNPEYQALRVELEALRASAEDDIVVDPKLLLKPGQTSPELPKLLTIIARGLTDETGGEYGELLSRVVTSDTYLAELMPLIQDIQETAGLQADGVIGPRTVAALAGTSKADRVDKVVNALEQLRWLPSDLGSPRVFINQPAFTASYIDGGVEKLKMRAVIGRPSNQTSFFYDEIEQVDYHPYWGVPQSIIVNEMLPRLRSDPGYLDRSGYEVSDAGGKRIPSASINWAQYGAKVPFNIRQSPSEANALGEVKILFPNKHAIYMHDTPSKSLFDQDVRAFSHGCVRLKDPRGMAAAVLGTTVEHVAEKLAEGHSTEKVTRKIPVYVAYFTAWPDATGRIEFFGDIYERDSRLKAAMESTDEVRAPST